MCDELLSRIAGLETRLAEVRADAKADLHSAVADIRAEVRNNSAQVKEVFALELRAVKAEILAALWGVDAPF